MSTNYNNSNNNHNSKRKPHTRTGRGIFFLGIAVILIVVLVWQLSYHIPRIQKASEDVKIAEDAVRLSKVWGDCAVAKVKAIEEGMQGPDCTAAKANALRASEVGMVLH